MKKFESLIQKSGIAIRLASRRNGVTSKELQKETGATRQYSLRLLNRLVDIGFLKRIETKFPNHFNLFVINKEFVKEAIDLLKNGEKQ
jgi:Fic family protein